MDAPLSVVKWRRPVCNSRRLCAALSRSGGVSQLLASAQRYFKRETDSLPEGADLRSAAERRPTAGEVSSSSRCKPWSATSSSSCRSSSFREKSKCGSEPSAERCAKERLVCSPLSSGSLSQALFLSLSLSLCRRAIDEQRRVLLRSVLSPEAQQRSAFSGALNSPPLLGSGPFCKPWGSSPY